MGWYGLVDTGAGEAAIRGGIGPSSEPGETGVKIYMRVDDLDAYLDRAEKLGGKRLLPPTDLPGDYGRFAVFTDPDGNQVGLRSGGRRHERTAAGTGGWRGAGGRRGAAGDR